MHLLSVATPHPSESYSSAITATSRWLWTSHSSHFSCLNSGIWCSTFMMTCQIKVVSMLMTTCQMKVMSNGHATRARVLLDCVSSTSFVAEALKWRLQLPCQPQSVWVARNGSPEHMMTDKNSTCCLCPSALPWKAKTAHAIFAFHDNAHSCESEIGGCWQAFRTSMEGEGCSAFQT